VLTPSVTRWCIIPRHWCITPIQERTTSAAEIGGSLIKVFAWIEAHLRREHGQDLIEYALLSGMIAAALALVAFLVLTGALESMFEGIGNCIDWDGDDCAVGL